jgi:type VI secretion system protein ImpL
MPIIALLVAAAGVLVLLWAAVWWLGLPLWLGVALTLLVVAGLAIGLGLRAWRIRRKAGAIERALAGRAAMASTTMRPDLAAEIDSMSAEFQRAVTALKRSRLGGGGRAALYALPWYVIVGPPGSGKSTALRNSGLAFPYVPSQGRGSVKGIGGTRNCDWWMSNEAVLLDTAGRWTTQDDDQEWFAFLDLLKRHRGRRPLNGILVAVSVDDLLSCGDDGRVALAARVRERVDEVMQRLGVALPVYVLVTKCDLIPGFAETFGEMSRAERGQLWGYTLPFQHPGQALGALVEARFDELLGTLDRFALRRLGQERRREARELIATTTSQLSLLRDPLTLFLTELFQPNVYRETPVLRGTYLTSGTQEGRPIDRLLGRIAEAAGLTGSVALPEPVLEPKSYFLTRVFFDVLFPDAKLVAPTQASSQRTQLAQIAAGIALCLGASIFTVGSAASWRANRTLVDSTRTVLATARSGSPTHVLPPGALEPLRARAIELRAHELEGIPLSMRLGLYQGDALREPVARAYALTMRNGVVATLAATDAMLFGAWGRRFELELDAEPTTEEHGRIYTALERYLRVSGPREPGEPPPDEEDRARLIRGLIERWADAQPAARTTPRETLAAHARLYVDLLEERPELRVARDHDAVRAARLGLSRLAPSRVALAELIGELEGRGYDLTLQRMIGSTGSAIAAREHVRGAYTRRAWDEHVRARIEASGVAGAGAAWVLGPDNGDADEHRRAVRDGFRRQYFAAYVEEWQRFVRGVRVRTAGDDAEALAMLEDLTRGDPPPLGRLLRAIDENLQLADRSPDAAPESAAEGIVATIERRVAGSPQLAGSARDAGNALAGAGARATETVPTDVVRQAFDGLVQFGVPPPTAGGEPPPVALDVYQEQLEALREGLTAYRDDPSTTEQLGGVLQTARSRVQSLIAEQPIGWRPLFETLLWPPVDGAATTSTRAMAGSVARSWCSSIAVPFHSMLAGRYPFAHDGHDAAIADFAAFYRPGSGTAWSFYDEAGLASEVERDGASFVFTTRYGRDAGALYRSTLPLFLERTQAITNAFFAPGANEPRVELDVQVGGVPGASSVRVAIGGTVIDYRNGPESWTRVVWPGERPEAGASIEVALANGQGERIREDGEWGLFRLFERASRVSGGGPGARTFALTWSLPAHRLEVTIQARSVRSESPFFSADDHRGRMLGPLRAIGVEAPRVITARGGECNVGR